MHRSGRSPRWTAPAPRVIDTTFKGNDMGILKGTLTFSRYRVSGDIPENTNDFIDEQLKRFAFRDITTSDKEKSVGWTSLDNILDTAFEYANYHLGEHIAFSLRIDRKQIPASLFKLKVMEAERRYKTEHDRNKLYKTERSDIKDSVRSQLIRMSPPVPSFFDVCWSPRNQWVLITSHSDRVLEDFEDIFKRTFQCTLIPAVPWDPAVLDQDTVQRLFTLKHEGV